MSQDPQPKRSVLAALPLTLIIGLVMMTLTLAWWLAYYAHVGSLFSDLDIKSVCLRHSSYGLCHFFTENMRPTVVPVFQSAAFWISSAVLALGVIQGLLVACRAVSDRGVTRR